MPNLTPEQEAAHIAGTAWVCPACGSEEIEVDDWQGTPENTARIEYRAMYCYGCEANWIEVWRLAEVIDAS